MCISSRGATPQSASVANTRRSQPSDTDLSASTNSTTPKRGRKSTKTATSAEQSSEEASTSTDRPVRIALSSHLVRNFFFFFS